MNERKKVAIVDYKMGNLFSVRQACVFLGYDANITSNKKDVTDADYVILPGVGAFGDAMITLDKFDLVAPMKDFIEAGRPFMGICLGLQLLFSESEEFGTHKGLNIIEGATKRFPTKDKSGEMLKVPQIEWNQIFGANENQWNSSPLSSCRNGEFMYFVHSYYVTPVSPELTLSYTEYGGLKYCSSVQKDNVFACQFHPEKSGEKGLSIYKNFLESFVLA